MEDLVGPSESMIATTEVRELRGDMGVATFRGPAPNVEVVLAAAAEWLSANPGAAVVSISLSGDDETETLEVVHEWADRPLPSRRSVADTPCEVCGARVGVDEWIHGGVRHCSAECGARVAAARRNRAKLDRHVELLERISSGRRVCEGTVSSGEFAGERCAASPLVGASMCAHHASEAVAFAASYGKTLGSMAVELDMVRAMCLDHESIVVANWQVARDLGAVQAARNAPPCEAPESRGSVR